jgi:hypothetical protein
MTDNLLIAEPTTSNEDSQNSGRPDSIPEKFWNAETQEIRVDALLNSYLALEKKLSKMLPIPENDDDKIRLQRALGLPESPDAYQVAVKADFIDIDPELNARLFAKGFTNEQVQEIYDLATEKLVPLILEMAAEFQADRELERLVEEFGGAEKWNLISTQLQDYGQKNLPRAAYEGLCCSYDGVMALYRMMKSGAVSPLSQGKSGNIEMMDEVSLRKMMQNPKYWRDRDPAYISKVSEVFQKIYGD